MLRFVKSLKNQQDLGLKAGKNEQEMRSSAMSFNPSVREDRISYQEVKFPSVKVSWDLALPNPWTKTFWSTGLWLVAFRVHFLDGPIYWLCAWEFNCILFETWHAALKSK